MKIMKSIVIGGLMSVSVLVVSAYNIWSPIQYVKKLILTSNGTTTGAQNIVLDGTNGNITANGDIKANSMHIGNEEVSTKNYVDNHIVDTDHIANNAITSDKIANNAITSSKIADWSITKTKLAADLQASLDNENKIVSVCNIDNVAKYNSNWELCWAVKVTNDEHCIKQKKYNVCLDGETLYTSYCCENGHVMYYGWYWYSEDKGYKGWKIVYKFIR